MADDYVQLAADGTGKKVDNESVLVGANTVYRQRTEVVGSAAAEVARVVNANPAGTEYALVTRNVPSGTQTVGQATGTNLHAVVDSGSITATQGTGTNLHTVVDSGTVTVSNPTANPETGLAKDATLTGGTAKTKLVDTGGTNVGTIKAASTAVVAGDTALAVGLHPTSPLPTGSNVIGALSANQSVNAAQVAGTAVSVNNGTVDAGTQRVTLASNSTGQVALAAGAATIGALTANQSVNVAQVAGVATSNGSRITDTGVLSVFQAAPATANILVGHQAQTVTTVATTIITIPSNRTWVGTITVTCDVANTGAVTTVGQALGTITTVGANVTPAAGTYVTCEARCGANVATGTVGTQGQNSITVPMVVNTGAATATLALASTQAGTNSRVAAICSGYLI